MGLSVCGHKTEVLNTEKISVFKNKLVCVPILIYGHESWVMIERVLLQVQAAEIFYWGGLRRDISR